MVFFFFFFLHRENKQSDIWFEAFPLSKVQPSPGRDGPGPHILTAQGILIIDVAYQRGLEQAPSPEAWGF